VDIVVNIKTDKIIAHRKNGQIAIDLMPEQCVNAGKEQRTVESLAPQGRRTQSIIRGRLTHVTSTDYTNVSNPCKPWVRGTQAASA
jgi:hypothetical protein